MTEQDKKRVHAAAIAESFVRCRVPHAIDRLTAAIVASSSTCPQPEQHQLWKDADVNFRRCRVVAYYAALTRLGYSVPAHEFAKFAQEHRSKEMTEDPIDDFPLKYQ